MITCCSWLVLMIRLLTGKIWDFSLLLKWKVCGYWEWGVIKNNPNFTAPIRLFFHIHRNHQKPKSKFVCIEVSTNLNIESKIRKKYRTKLSNNQQNKKLFLFKILVYLTEEWCKSRCLRTSGLKKRIFFFKQTTNKKLCQEIFLFLELVSHLFFGK